MDYLLQQEGPWVLSVRNTRRESVPITNLLKPFTHIDLQTDPDTKTNTERRKRVKLPPFLIPFWKLWQSLIFIHHLTLKWPNFFRNLVASVMALFIQENVPFAFFNHNNSSINNCFWPFLSKKGSWHHSFTRALHLAGLKRNDITETAPAFKSY